MTTDTCITLWHNGVRQFFPVISVKTCSSIDKNGIKQHGFFDSSECIVRIPSKTQLQISIGDFVRLGKHEGQSSRADDFKVMKIFNNLRGITPHYKLVCEK